MFKIKPNLLKIAVIGVLITSTTSMVLSICTLSKLNHQPPMPTEYSFNEHKVPPMRCHDHHSMPPMGKDEHRGENTQDASMFKDNNNEHDHKKAYKNSPEKPGGEINDKSKLHDGKKGDIERNNRVEHKLDNKK